MESPLHWAAKRGYTDIVELLLTYDAELEKIDFVRKLT
jgi:ankyrin repeat protein